MLAPYAVGAAYHVPPHSLKLRAPARPNPIGRPSKHCRESRDESVTQTSSCAQPNAEVQGNAPRLAIHLSGQNAKVALPFRHFTDTVRSLTHQGIFHREVMTDAGGPVGVGGTMRGMDIHE